MSAEAGTGPTPGRTAPSPQPGATTGTARSHAGPACRRWPATGKTPAARYAGHADSRRGPPDLEPPPSPSGGTRAARPDPPFRAAQPATRRRGCTPDRYRRRDVTLNQLRIAFERTLRSYGIPAGEDIFDELVSIADHHAAEEAAAAASESTTGGGT